MEADSQSSDDEVFTGEITEKERQRPVFLSRRRTTLYFPGISRPDSSIKVYQEVTDDGTLLFSCEDEQQQDEGHLEMGQSSSGAEGSKDDGPESRAMLTMAEKSAEDVVKPADVIYATASTSVESNTATGATANNLGENESKNVSQDNLSMKPLNTDSKMDCAADSDYCSVSDVSLTCSAASNSWSFSAENEMESESFKETTMEDIKCKVSSTSSSTTSTKGRQLISPKVRTVQLQSPHLLVSPVARYIDSDNHTATPIMKRHIASGGMPLPPDETVSTSSEHFLQSSESAFSKLQLRSPKLEAKFHASPITKDFLHCSESEHNVNLINHDNLTVPSSATARTHQLLPPMKRKIAQRSPPHEPRAGGTERDADKRIKNCNGIAGTMSLPSETSTTGAASSPKHPNSDIISSLSESKSVCEGGRQPDRLPSAGGDAQSLKPCPVFVPETPDIRSMAVRLKVNVCDQPIQTVQNECSFDSDSDSIPPSQEAAQDTKPLPRKKAKPDAAPLSPLSRFLLNNPNYNFSAKRSVPTLKINLSSALFSPDLFSPAGFGRSPLVRPPRAESPTVKLVHSSVAGTSARRSRLESLQPIKEDGPPEERPVPTLRNKENEAEESSHFFTLPACECQHNINSQGSVTTVCSSSCSKNRSSTSLPREVKAATATTADKEGADASEPKVMTVTRPQWYLHSPPTGTKQRRASPGVQYFQPEPTEEELEEESRAALTRVNTMINGKTMHKMLDPESSPALLTEFPAPRVATRVSWRESLALEEEQDATYPSTPRTANSTPSSILQQRPIDHEFPFSEDPPSPIVLTRKRLPRFQRLFNISNN